MALTQIRGEQIRDGIIKDRHIAADAAVAYSKLDLAGQIVASDLNGDSSVEQAALDSKLIALWDMVQGVQTGTGSSVVVTTEVLASASTDTPQTGVTAKGVLLTGTGTDGAGTTNYRVQIRNAATGEPIADGTDSDPSDAANAASVYAELRHDGSDYTLFFFNSNDQAYTFSADTAIDILFLEVFSYLTAPAKGFIAGVGFADVVGIQGSHNHHDLYYTETQLDGGQLDNRYYTETELNSGQLDNRYYTETELDPLAAATGDNVLDARYFRESELASSASGSAGASLIGVDAAAVSGLDSVTVQGALAELQGDINDITSGTINIDHSMDDAYDDGSVITVDTTNVDFQLTDTKSFQVSDSVGAAIVKVDALSAGDAVAVTGALNVVGDTSVTGAFDVTGASTLDAVTIAGALGQSGGAVTLNAGANAVDVDGGTITVDGSSIAVASTGALTLKDSSLVSAIALAQANATALAPEFAYNSQTDFDWSTRDIGITAPASIVAAINVNREDLYEYVELVATQGAAVGVAAGANLVGVDGITGIIPTGGTVGADSTLQAMLEGIAQSAGGVKTYANESAFTSDKAAGSYLPVDTMVFIKDINRFAIVKVDGVGVTEGTDFDYLWDASNPMSGVEFTVSAPVSITGNTDITGTFGVVGASTFDAVTMEGNLAQSAGTVVLNSNGIVDIDAVGAITLNGASISQTAAVDGNVTFTTTGNGQVHANSSAEIDLNAPLVDIHGDVTVQAGYQLSVDQINITSVDPTDFATITGQRTGIPFTGNLLVNPGFETGSGADADSWTEGTFSGRSSTEKYYDNFSYHYNNSSELGGVNALATQAVTGLTVASHIVSVWFKGVTTSPVEVVVNGGTAATLIPASTTTTSWTRYNVDVTPGAADGNFVIQVNGTAADANDFFIDAVQLEEGTGAPTNYFSTYQSELILRIGNEAEDKISFQSQAPDGGSISELMSINNSTVSIFGDLQVQGTTTTVNSSVVDIADQTITLNAGQASGLLDASLEVDRGSDPTAAIRWNETSDKWELTNDGTTYSSIVTSGSGGVLSMDQAYDGGSAVAVDNTDVVFTMDATKSFTLADGTDTSKFKVNAGTGTDSVKIATSGGVDIDVDAGFRIDEASGTYLELASSGAVNFVSTNQLYLQGGGNLSLNSTTNLFMNSALIDINGSVDMDGSTFDVDTTGAFSLDAAAASNVSVDGANLTLSTITSGNVIMNAAGAVDIDGVGATVTSAGGNIALSTVTSGNISLTSVGALTLDDQFLSSPIALSETGTTGLSGFTATSIVGALNEVKADVEGANTFDEIYDGESAVARIVTVDDGNVEFQVADTYEFNIADSVGADILSVKALTTGDVVDINASVDMDGALFDVATTSTTASSIKLLSAGGIDIDSAEGFNVADDSGASIVATSAGALTLTGIATSTLTASAVNVTASSGNATVSGTNVNLTGNVVHTGGTLTSTSTGATSFAAQSASDFTVTGASLTFATATAGDVIVSSAGGVDVSGGAISIDGTAASNVTVTGNSLTLSTATAGNVILSSAGELTLKDSRTAAIPFSDVSNTSLPGDATSILGALTTAYEKSIDMGYEEKAVNSADVTNDYVVLTDTAGVLPTSGITFPAAPSALRGAGYYVAAYLNGLRLSDTEWNYNYSGGTKSITFDGSDDITLVAGDKVMVEVKKIN